MVFGLLNVSEKEQFFKYVCFLGFFFLPLLIGLRTEDIKKVDNNNWMPIFSSKLFCLHRTKNLCTCIFLMCTSLQQTCIYLPSFT